LRKVKGAIKSSKEIQFFFQKSVGSLSFFQKNSSAENHQWEATTQSHFMVQHEGKWAFVLSRFKPLYTAWEKYPFSFFPEY